ncbi:MAG: glycosyl transferase [Leptolyngbya sp.]|jgi:glycosyltransferase involved in cell wall biosynthesis|uniref:Glycosyl transferase n=1 Tax=Shackletoniella antarctica TaxID=268115 RepID=A0A2W4XXS6_9CYAN|nr:MAG: glycosyl transferase [Shackletoniella antarctica]PZV19990.1 MAG: glycosyl transferase [Leptolyngbya sp.]
MRVAQVTPLWEQVPPLAYGGTEIVVSLLTEELVRRGHQVTLFASGDSHTLALLEPGCDRALRSLGVLPPAYAGYEQRQLDKVFSGAKDFDIIHSHMDSAALSHTHLSRTPVVHTLHGPFSAASEKTFSRYRQQNLVSVSKSQQRHELGLNYVATVYNAIAIDQFDFYPQPQEPPYLAFLGRMSVEKGPHLAIEIAKRSGWRLKMAGKVDFENRDFFDREVAPYIDGEQITFLGEVTPPLKKALMGYATATLFPITWPEPFGLVMTESMASGTPVIAMALGSAPEIVADGETGFLCSSVDDCVAAVAKVHSLSRQACRDHVALNFGVGRMVDGYEAVYRGVMGAHSQPTSAARTLDVRSERAERSGPVGVEV